MNTAGSDDDLRAVITSGMLAMSRKAQHLDGGGGYIPGNWALPPVSKQAQREGNPQQGLRQNL